MAAELVFDFLDESLLDLVIVCARLVEVIQMSCADLIRWVVLSMGCSIACVNASCVTTSSESLVESSSSEVSSAYLSSAIIITTGTAVCPVLITPQICPLKSGGWNVCSTSIYYPFFDFDFFCNLSALI